MSKKDIQVKLYGAIHGGIDDIIKNHLTEVSYTKLSDVGRKGLKTALGKVNIDHPKAPAIKEALLANIPQLEAFIDNHSGVLLKETNSYRKPIIERVKGKPPVWANEADYKELVQYFTLETKTVTTTAESVAKQQARYDDIKANPAYKGKNVLNPEPSKVGDTTSFTGYKITDTEALIAGIKRDIAETVSYALETPETGEQSDLLKRWGELDKTLLDIADLNKTIGIERAGEAYAYKQTNTETGKYNITYGGTPPEPKEGIEQVIIYLDDVLTRDFIVWALADIKRTADKSGAGREVVNILNPEQHRYIGRPTTMGLLDMITKTIDGKDLADLKEQYIDRDSRKDSGGFLTHVSDPQTALPFDISDVGLDRNQKAKLVGNVVALTVQAVGALQAYKRDNPDSKGNIPIKDLAKYISRYSDDMAKNKGTLRPQYRQAILNGLTLATLAGDSYIISKDKKTGKARHGVVYLINRITEYETNKKGEITAVTTDFTPEYKASLQYNLGVLTDGVSKLKSPEAINLATYISDRQVAEQDKTVAGKPITFTADTLCKKASIVDKHVTKRYSTLAKLLDELQTESVAVGRWVTKSKGKAITGYDKDSQTLYIYPTTTAQNSYTTRERTKAVREAYKTEQAGRVKALKRYAKGYTDLEALASEMGVDRPELEGLLAGNKPITDGHLESLDLDI